ALCVVGAALCHKPHLAESAVIYGFRADLGDDFSLQRLPVIVNLLHYLFKHSIAFIHASPPGTGQTHRFSRYLHTDSTQKKIFAVSSIGSNENRNSSSSRT